MSTETQESTVEVFSRTCAELTDTEILEHVNEERKKYTTADTALIEAMVTELIARGVYPKETVEGNPNTVHQMVDGWGAYWHIWEGRFACLRCGADLRNHRTGPPFLISDPNMGSCPQCTKEC